MVASRNRWCNHYRPPLEGHGLIWANSFGMFYICQIHNRNGLQFEAVFMAMQRRSAVNQTGHRMYVLLGTASEAFLSFLIIQTMFPKSQQNIRVTICSIISINSVTRYSCFCNVCFLKLSQYSYFWPLVLKSLQKVREIHRVKNRLVFTEESNSKALSLLNIISSQIFLSWGHFLLGIMLIWNIFTKNVAWFKLTSRIQTFISTWKFNKVSLQTCVLEITNIWQNCTMQVWCSSVCLTCCTGGHFLGTHLPFCMITMALILQCVLGGWVSRGQCMAS